MEILRKLFNAFMVVCFIVSAALQYNDPDPYVWMPLYLAGAWIAYQAYYNKFNGKLYAACALIYSCYAVYLFFTADGVLSWFRDHDEESLVQTMKATKPWIEQTREFGGLLILLATLLFNWIIFRRPASTK